MLDEILELNQRAAAEGNFETAYHLLMAALHHLDHAGDDQGLGRLVELAKKQAKDVEAVVPSHHLSRKLARLRGQTALYDSFQAHVEAVRLRIQSARQLKR